VVEEDLGVEAGADVGPLLAGEGAEAGAEAGLELAPGDAVLDELGEEPVQGDQAPRHCFRCFGLERRDREHLDDLPEQERGGCSEEGGEQFSHACILPAGAMLGAFICRVRLRLSFSLRHANRPNQPRTRHRHGWGAAA